MNNPRSMFGMAIAFALLIAACTSPDPETEPAGRPTAAQPEPASYAPGHVRLETGDDWILIDEHGNRFSAKTALAKKAYVSSGLKWFKTNLTYKFNGTWDSRATNLVHTAFTAVGSVVPLEFQYAPTASFTDFVFTLMPASEMRNVFGETTTSYAGGTSAPYRITRADVYLTYSGSSMTTRDNLFLKTAMHEIVHGLGLGDNDLTGTLMNRYISVINGIPVLYFLANDDIQGLQSLYGAVTPRYPSWDHRYTIVTKAYSSQVPYPGAPPLGWVTTGDSYPLWSSLKNRFAEINYESFKVAMVR